MKQSIEIINLVYKVEIYQKGYNQQKKVIVELSILSSPFNPNPNSMTTHSLQNQEKSQQTIRKVLNNQPTQVFNEQIKFIIEDSNLHLQKISAFSEILKIDIKFLLQNPNQISSCFAAVENYLIKESPYQQNYGIITSQSKVLRFLALVCFIHPVLSKKVQQIMVKYSLFSQISFQNRYDLQSLNILSLIPTFSFELLKLSEEKLQFKQNTYQQALWLNVVNTLTYGQFYQEWRLKINEIEEENVCKVRQLINAIHDVKKITQKIVYEQFFLTLVEEKNIIKIQQTTSPQEILTEPKKSLNSLAIFLSFHNFITIDYLPQNFLFGENQQHIQIWIDRTVQVNSLMGNFICKQKLGEFQYVKGPLLYAIQKGIVLVLNNFEQVSHELLVTMRTLCTRNEINHNQRTVHVKSGFKIIGICSQEGRKKSKALQNSNTVIPHFYQITKTIEDFIPFSYIKNQTNKSLIYQTLERVSGLGLKTQVKLWKRMTRLRKRHVNQDFTQKDEKYMIEQLWNGYLTESFKDQIQVEIQELSNQIDYTRHIEFQREYKTLKIGRCELTLKNSPHQNIVPTQYSLRILERLAICQDPQINECPLLISETGCGKTTLVQYLAEIASKKLYVYNMSSGTDVSDLVGGFKPIDCRVMLKQLFYTFTQKFMNQVPGAQKNKTYVNSLITYYEQNKLQILLKSLIQSIPKIKTQLKDISAEDLKIWDDMLRRFTNILNNLDKIDSNLVFSFMEGNLVTALKNGDWVLIDEINLATNDVLQKIVPLVEGKSILLYEKGDLIHVSRNSGFKIIGCMNPATDSGKKPLPPNLHDKFTPINLSQPSRNDIEMMVGTLCPQLNPTQIADIYFEIKKTKTVSLRNLSRSLAYINKNRQIYGWQRATYDGLVLGYGDKDILIKYKNEVTPKEKEGFKMINGFLIQEGPVKDQKVQIFHLTKTFSEHLKDFLRAIAGTDLPVLLEGPTSAGKTSIIKYVAELAGHKCIRINNHEHTEIEEYLGNYFPDKQGKLVFRQGPLVTAVRQGHWLILDELNLAKTQILECLNRLLDDNRELFIPQQQKHIKPHKNFRIFATQNPSSYSGRKKLSRAFRNRFISLMFNDITVVDTMAILEARRSLVGDSKQLSSYIKKVLQALINYRQRQKVFSKDGLITMRDLLKWTGRKFINKQMFIIEGYGILAERLRTLQEKEHVFQVLSGGSKITHENIFQYYQKVVAQNLGDQKVKESKIYVQMNKSFKRMAALTYLGIESNEAILLVGETGCGKTTLAQLLSYVLKRPFYSINCHKHTQAADLLGSLRPSSDPNSNSKFQFVNGVVIQAMLNGGILLIDEINTAEDSVLERLNEVLQSNTIGVERGSGWESIKAKEGFCIIATMNPSGDYGKKELSPALRNRFTEIWVEPITHPQLIVEAKPDILLMIETKLKNAYSSQINASIALLIYEFMRHYNCEITERYNLSRKRMTMRDIGWMCKFLTQSKQHFHNDWKKAYYWALNILAIQGLNFMMNDEHQTVLLKEMKVQLTQFIADQCQIKPTGGKKDTHDQLQVIRILKDMDFPLMIKTDLPLDLLSLHPDARIFFSSHTDLSDLLGQFQPLQNSFVWKDQQLLKRIRYGGRTALMDLNLAQQQVIEGVNSLFDYRGSIFVVQLNETVSKHKQFKPMVVLKYTAGNERKGLPNSFLNRFVKICVENVSLEMKLNYLKNKYEGMSEDLISVLVKILQKEKSYPIERLQLICQVCVKSAIQLESCIEFLQLGEAIDIDRYFLIENQLTQNIPIQIAQQYEERVLSLLPLVKEFNLYSHGDIQNVQKINLIYQLSKFSACLIGNCKKRDQIVEVLGYLLDKKITKIILSTMTDMNDLLGSYEQITEENQQTKMQEERSLQNAFCNKKQQAQQGKKTKFVYQQSSIVKALKDDQTLLYIQVPNQILLQRVEKGLIEVYEQKKQIILGIDSMRQTKSTTTKFIPMRLTEQNHQSVTSHLSSLQHFTENMSKLIHLNPEIRKKQLQNYLEDIIRNQTSRPKILCLKKMMVENQNSSINSIQTQSSLHQKQVKCRQKKIKQLPFKYSVQKINTSLQDMYRNVKSFIKTQSCDFSSYKMKSVLRSLMGMTLEEINRKSSVYGREQERILQIVQRYQVLFICNINDFQLTSLRILSVIFSPKLSVSQSQEMLFKFGEEIDRLYEELFNDKITEVMIKFNDQETRVIPILKNIETVRYVMKEHSLSFRLMSQICPRYSHTLNEGVEKQIVSTIQLLKISFKDISEWINTMRLKDMQPYSIFEDKIKSKESLLVKKQNILESCHKFMSDILPQNFKLQYFGYNLQSQAFIHKMLSLFKPAEQISQNVCLHIKSELQYETLKQVISEDKVYLQCYKQICQVKYLGLESNKYKLLSKSILKYQDRLKILAKSIVYRGHDNIKSLLEFYEYLMNAHAKIQQSGFDSKTILSVLIESYDSYYETFSDILLPYYLPLVYVYMQKSLILHQQSLAVQILSQTVQQSPVIELLEQIITREQDEENDRAKDYIKYQRKFNRTVIIDEYTEEGVQKNKRNLEEEFNELFGKNEQQDSGNLTEVDQLFYLLNKDTQHYYNHLCTLLNSQTQNYEQLIVSLALTTSNKTLVNIYEQRNTSVIAELIKPIPKMLYQVHVLLQKYRIDTLKALAGLLGKVYEHKTYKDEVYKILVDCEFIIEKSFELNSILPAVQRVPTDELIAECLKLRRLELKNWKSMLYYKQQRTQKSDTINLIQFYKTLKMAQNSKEIFALSQNFLRESTVSCLHSRMYFLDLLAKSYIKDEKMQTSIYRVIGFYEYLMPHVTQFYMNSYNQKVLEMKEYEKLAGWSSNEYLIFKATCEKFQRKIHHILRKFDDELSMSLAMLIQQVKTKQTAHASVQQFNTKTKKDLDLIVETEQEQNQEMKDQNQQNSQQKAKQKPLQKKKNKKVKQQPKPIPQQSNEYEEIIRQLFECLNELSEGYQNSQSKLRIIRVSLQQLEQIIKTKKQQVSQQNKAEGSIVEKQIKYLAKEMFQTQEQYTKTCKHYYGLWDKLCQRHQTAWNRDIVERVWNVAQNIWHLSNLFVPNNQLKSQENELIEDLKVLFKPYLIEQVTQQIPLTKYFNNPIFQRQIQNVKNFIINFFSQQVQTIYEKKISSTVQSMMKLGYLISSIALNLQKNGLCVKEDEQNQNQESGQQQVGDGMGIGQGQIHDAAENVGDEIQFEEQVQGNKDEQKVQQDRGDKNKQEENDIQMEGDFQGQMYDKQKGSEDDKQGQQAQEISDQQMGQVDNQKRQEDIKNQQGQAEGKGDADVDIDGQQGGEQQLVDNERQQDKQQRKGQQKRQNENADQEEQEERSDWEDNNQQGQKINKQNENVEEHQRDSENMKDQKQPEQISDEQGDQNSSGQSVSNQNQMDQENNQQNSKQPEELSDQNDEAKQNEQIQIQNSEEPMEEQPQQPNQEEKEKKQAKNKKQYERTYGRQDNQFQNNNLVHDQDINDQQNMGEGQQNAQGSGEGQKGAGKSVHSLREQFLQEIMKKQNQSKGNEEYHKNLDVRIQQENDEEIEQNGDMNAEDQQYALTEQEDKKMATNLGMMDIQEKKKQQEKKEAEKDRERNAKQKQQEKLQQQKSQQMKNDKKKPSQKDSKNNELTKQDQAQSEKTKKQEQIKQQQQNSQNLKRQPTKPEQNRQKVVNLIDQHQESLIKAAVSSLTNDKKSQIPKTFAQHSHLITQSYLLSKILEEQLKSVLQPLDQAEYKGDYKTGKKLNLKKIIPFIASNYRKDRIWLRRTQPSQRNYHIMLALDDTKSMHYGDVGEQALKGLLSISLALQHLNIKTCITSIKDSMEICKNFSDLLNCQKILEDFSFQYESSNSHDLSMSSFMASSLSEFEKVQAMDANGQSRQLCIIISDGKMNKQMVKPFLKEASKKGITYVFIIIDSQKNSILNIKTVEYVNGKMEIKSYMNDFPFDFFLVVNNAKELGDILGATLMQFIQEK